MKLHERKKWYQQLNLNIIAVDEERSFIKAAKKMWGNPTYTIDASQKTRGLF